jgi:hypothetical protein
MQAPRGWRYGAAASVAVVAAAWIATLVLAGTAGAQATDPSTPPSGVIDYVPEVFVTPPPPVVPESPAVPIRVAPAAPAAIETAPLEVAAPPETVPEVRGAVVEADDPPPVEVSEPESDRSTFASGLATEIDLSPAWVAGSAGIGGLLVLAVLAAAQLFNDAMKTHHDELVRQLGDRTTVLGRGRMLLAAFPHPPVVVSFAAVAAVMGLLGDPSVAFSVNTLAQMFGMVMAVGAIAVIYDGFASRLVGRETGMPSRFRLYPLAIAVAILCLTMSRFLGVAPGVLYGLFIGVAFAGKVESRILGRAYAGSSTLLLGAAMAAFLLHRLVAPAAEGASPSFWAIAIDTAAAALVVGGTQAVIVQLLPTRFVNGENILRWSRAGWFALLAAAMTLYVLVVVRPSDWSPSRWSSGSGSTSTTAGCCASGRPKMPTARSNRREDERATGASDPQRRPTTEAS